MRVRDMLVLVGLVASLTTVGTVTMSASPAAATLPDVKVTVIDTGVRVTHQEFDYVSQTDTTDQVVAWWDFSAEASPAFHLPGSGDVWDTTTNGGEPWDNNGHGTATASAAVGLNAASSTTKRPSLCPGCKLAIAKVGEADGHVADEMLAKAIKWARETVHTNVITISIGAAVPIPAAYYPYAYLEMRLARQAGILVVVANGNGIVYAPGPGFATSFGNSPYVLSVGAGRGRDSVFDSAAWTETTDPEVTSDFFNVPLASSACDTCYGPVTGTSFSTPIVAGFAARLWQENPAMSMDYLEKLIKYSAIDTLALPITEGYGLVDGMGTQLSDAIAHAAAGTLPARPSPDIDGLYVETANGALDDVWADKLNEGAQIIVNPGIGTTSPPGVIGHSAPTGLSDAELYKLTANAGDVVTVNASYTTPGVVDDFDLYILRVEPTASFGMPTGGQMVTWSARPAGVDEAVSFVAPSTGDYYVVALGHLVLQPQAFTLTSNKTLSSWYQGYVLHTFGTGYPYVVETIRETDLPPLPPLP